MNPMDIFKNLKQVQEKMQESQAKLKDIRAIGTAGGDMVQLEINGEFSILSLQLSPEIVDPNDITMLQDLIRAAHSDAMVKVKEEIQKEMGSIGDGLGLPKNLFG